MRRIATVIAVAALATGCASTPTPAAPRAVVRQCDQADLLVEENASEPFSGAADGTPRD